jgi:UDP-N-acetylglucosamine 2-epimerase (non-hydrolysing)
MMKKLKVVTVLGTRPEIIRLSKVMALLDECVEHKIIHTGQNYDYELNQVFFEELGVRSPDYYLDIDTSSLGRSLADITLKTEDVLLKEKPDAVLVLGDTNSATSVMIAKRMKIPTYHMEAGNRSFDANVPEEINRKLVDHLADFNLVYTEHARRHLLSEGLPHRFIYLTGSPMREVLDGCFEKIKASIILDKLNLQPRGYFIVSCHREENVDSPENLKEIVMSLEALYERYQKPIIVSTHPRTKKRLETLGLLSGNDNIKFSPPFGFFDYNKLQLDALCAVSDSGTISEESAILNFPAVTLRRSIERPEALDTGAIILTGFESEILLQNIEIAIQSCQDLPCTEYSIPEEYKINNTSERVVKLIAGTAKLTSKWRNMDDFSRYDW